MLASSVLTISGRLGRACRRQFGWQYGQCKATPPLIVMAYVCSDFASYILTVYENSLEDGWIIYVKAKAVQWSLFPCSIAFLEWMECCRCCLVWSWMSPLRISGILLLCLFCVPFIALSFLFMIFFLKKNEIGLCCSQVQVHSCWYFDLRRSPKQNLPW